MYNISSLRVNLLGFTSHKRGMSSYYTFGFEWVLNLVSHSKDGAMTKLMQSVGTLVQTPGTAGCDVTQLGGGRKDKCIHYCPGTMTFFVLPCANDLIKSLSRRHSIQFHLL